MIACVRRGCVDVARHIHARRRRKGKQKFDNCAKNPENLRGQDFAKSEDMRGQTRSFGAQTVSSHVFNAKSCPLRFSRNLRKALRPGTPHPRTSQAEGKTKI